ncbi:hypothetical protein [Streptomyces crystallinus]|uniref:Uncharacterized protein n=1 Tax=Streptomyces crystallinus TaxID=68191 RepID=A0ABP3RLP5_9ACTN
MDKAHRRRFGPEFVAAQREKYGHRQPQGRMLSYDLAVEDRYEPWRAWLDEQLALLPEREAEAFAANLGRDQNFWPYNIELAAGAALRERGFTVEYERRWGTLTPDWTVTDAAGAPIALVEVLTHSPPKAMFSRMRDWHELAQRVREIPVPVVLTVAGHPDRPLDPPVDARAAKQIAQALRRWLLSPLDLVSFTSHGYTFRIMADHRTGGPIQAPFLGAVLEAPSQMAGVVSAQPLAAVGIKEKLHKYRDLAQEASLPLILAAGSHRFTGLTVRHFDDLLSGANTVSVQFGYGDTFIHPPIEVQPGRPRRWAMPPDLAGVLWIDHDNFPSFTTHWRPNSQALRPAPAPFTPGH